MEQVGEIFAKMGGTAGVKALAPKNFLGARAFLISKLILRPSRLPSNKKFWRTYS